MNGAAELPMAEPPEERTWYGRTKQAVAFPELVLAHYLRQQELYEKKAPGEAEERYRRYLDAFEEAHGDILDVYWSSNEISAVALTLKRRRFARDRLRIHRVSDWATRSEPELAKALHDCETLAVKISMVLRDTPQRVALQWVYALMSYLLGVVDSAKGTVSAADRRRAIAAADAERNRIERYYEETAVRGAQIVYFWGMVLGAFVMSLITIVLAFTIYLFDATEDDIEIFLACALAGGAGAFLSVIQRVTSGHFKIDYELGRGALRRLGSFRPFIGVVLGVAIFCLALSGVLQIAVPDENNEDFFFLVILAFLAGFSERFAKDILDEAAGAVPTKDQIATGEGGSVEPTPAVERSQHDAYEEAELEVAAAEADAAAKEAEAPVELTAEDAAEAVAEPEDGVPAGVR